MSHKNKAILEQANAAISRGDFEGFLAYCTDHTEWNFVGDQVLRGKEAVRRWMAQTYKTPPKFDVRQVIAEGDTVVALGSITLTDETGAQTTSSYCDVWRFSDDRLAELHAYVVSAD